MLEDAQACAEGYLVCCRTAKPADAFEFTCYRCNATTYNIDDLINLYCLACGHRFNNFYTSGPSVVTHRPKRAPIFKRRDPSW
jgi:hypothetical protein